MESIPYKQERIEYYTNKIREIEENYPKQLAKLKKTEKEVNQRYKDIFSWCADHHQCRGSLYQRGLLNFHNGIVEEAIEDIDKLIQLSNENGDQDALPKDLFLFDGKIKAELGLYHDAIHSLTRAIDSDPTNKEAYLERAFAYFETGDFSQSLADFMASGYKSSPNGEKIQQSVDYAAGLIAGGVVAGSLQGGVQALVDMPYLVFKSFHGLSSGLWTMACNPSQVSKELISACQSCVDYIRTNTPEKILLDLAPEIQQLVTHFNTLNDYQKGELVGTAIGKYGVEIFSGAGALRCMKAFRDLKRANDLLTLERCAASEANAAAILQSASKRWQLRQEVCKNANLKVQWDKQGKHIEGHRNYEPDRFRSIFEHPDPQNLIQKHAGSGIKTFGSTPGLPGYVEVVNFEEFIGYSINDKTGLKTPTTYGKIHYSKDGVHIVPTHPKGK